MSFRMVFELMVITKKQVQPLDFSYGVHVGSLTMETLRQEDGSWVLL